jgi:nitrile hydratase beta subunit
MLESVGTLSDMGGRRELFGPIVREPDEPVFHSRAEGRVFGVAGFVLVLVGNLDQFRFAMERLPREIYESSYYRRVLAGCESLLVRGGYLGPDEVDARIAGTGDEPGRRRGSRVRLSIVAGVMRSLQRPTFPRWVAAHLLPRVVGASRPTLRRPRFSVGDRIRVRGRQAEGHTRQPGYVTGKPGVITAHLGATLFPDARARGRRLGPRHLYTVAFEGSDLWGEQADAGTEARVDLYEPYLEPA